MLYSFICRTAGEVCSGVITKCLNASRAKTKEKGLEILLMFIEIEKTDIVVVSMIFNPAFTENKIKFCNKSQIW